MSTFWILGFALLCGIGGVMAYRKRRIAHLRTVYARLRQFWVSYIVRSEWPNPSPSKEKWRQAIADYHELRSANFGGNDPMMWDHLKRYPWIHDPKQLELLSD